MASKRSEVYFNNLWDNVIKNELADIVKEEGPCVSCANQQEARDRIWEAYVAFNKHASVNYMKNSEKPLDRHKVAACYAYACMVAQPLHIDRSANCGARQKQANEILAISVGCDVLAGFLDRAFNLIEKHNYCSAKLVEEGRNRLDSNFDLKYIVGYSTYIDSMLSCLTQTKREKNYNILALSIIMFHWEQSLFSEEILLCLAKLIGNIEAGRIDEEYVGD